MTRHIPNLLTLSNLFSGCCALLYILLGQMETAVLFTAGCFVFDYLDGMTARAFQVHSPLGKELDSLADVVSFGVVPGAMMYHLILAGVCGNGLHIRMGGDSIFYHDVCQAALPAFVLSAFSAMRLAKFNLDTRQTSYFVGLSTPACTIFVLGLALGIYNNRFGMSALLAYPVVFYGLTAVLSWLLVSEIPMFGMKIKRFDLKSNAFNLIFLGLFVVLLLLLKELALPAIIICYIAASIAMKDRVVSGHPTA
jgi:CDP-diacylglycerol--serine O-phosphatidyltransferase